MAGHRNSDDGWGALCSGRRGERSWRGALRERKRKQRASPSPFTVEGGDPAAGIRHNPKTPQPTVLGTRPPSGNEERILSNILGPSVLSSEVRLETRWPNIGSIEDLASWTARILEGNYETTYSKQSLHEIPRSK